MGILVQSQGFVARHQYVDPQVKLLPANQQGVFNVSRYKIGILCRQACPTCATAPLFDLRQAIDDEDALPLGSICRLHNPDGISVPSKFLHKQAEHEPQERA